jgi:hypothetical protein
LLYLTNVRSFSTINWPKFISCQHLYHMNKTKMSQVKTKVSFHKSNELNLRKLNIWAYIKELYITKKCSQRSRIHAVGTSVVVPSQTV